MIYESPEKSKVSGKLDGGSIKSLGGRPEHEATDSRGAGSGVCCEECKSMMCPCATLVKRTSSEPNYVGPSIEGTEELGEQGEKVRLRTPCGVLGMREKAAQQNSEGTGKLETGGGRAQNELCVARLPKKERSGFAGR